MEDDFDGETLSPEWISVRRFPAELASLQPGGGAALTGDGSTLDDLQPVFLARRPQHQQLRVSVRVDPGAGLGGLAVRFDELHHYEIEVGGGLVTVRAAVAGIRQEWTAPAPSEVVTLHLDCEPPTGPKLLDWLTSDIIVLGVSDSGGDGRVDIARVDGRYLSQETAASFTGRVIGVYAVRGTVTFSPLPVHRLGGLTNMVGVPDGVRFGAAYYTEYQPYERLDDRPRPDGGGWDQH